MAGQNPLPRWQDKHGGGSKQRGGVFSAARPGQRQVACVFIVGCAVGLVVGYVLMGTAHAVLETRLENHYGKENIGIKAISLTQASSDAAVTTIEPVRLQTKSATPDCKYPEAKAAAAALIKGERSSLDGHSIHSVITSNGSPYQNWQTRIMYSTYQTMQKMPGGERHAGFTRILHKMKGDELMDHVPTFRANPLHPACDEWCDFPVADRPNAVRQWIEAVEQGDEPLGGAWVLMLECDYVMFKPIPAPDAYDPTAKGLSFAFDYIDPVHPDCFQIIKRLYGGGDPHDVPNSGPAPVLVRYGELKGVTPVWERITADIEKDAEAVKVLEWIREMYAWSIAVAVKKVRLENQAPPKTALMVQPPHDLELGPAGIYHYTWGTTYKEGGKELWKWDKREIWDIKDVYKPKVIPEPPQPWREGLKLQDGYPITKNIHDMVTDMIRRINAAIVSLPDITPKK